MYGGGGTYLGPIVSGSADLLLRRRASCTWCTRQRDILRCTSLRGLRIETSSMREKCPRAAGRAMNRRRWSDLRPSSIAQSCRKIGLLVDSPTTLVQSSLAFR